jgi:hypothetical protein
MINRNDKYKHMKLIVLIFITIAVSFGCTKKEYHIVEIDNPE